MPGRGACLCAAALLAALAAALLAALAARRRAREGFAGGDDAAVAVFTDRSEANVFDPDEDLRDDPWDEEEEEDE